MQLKIIIADDHRVIIDGIKALLAQEGDLMIAGEAEDGEQLMELVSKNQPDLVLLDIQMPRMDGLQATMELRRKFPNVKVIILTMFKEGYYIKKILEAGAHGYLLKTAGKAEILEAIHKVAGGDKYFSADVMNHLVNNFPSKYATDSPLESLTKREREILILIAQGLTDKEIAEKVCLSPLTISTHRKNILNKLDLKNKVELTRFAIDHHLLP